MIIVPIEHEVTEAMALAFVAERKFLIRQIEEIYRIPARMFACDIYRLAAFTQEGRIESSIRLKVVGA